MKSNSGILRNSLVMYPKSFKSELLSVCSYYRGIGLSLMTIMILASGCIHQPTKAFILTGSSFVSNDQAVRELQNAINNAQNNGCRAVSVGGGTGAGLGLGLGMSMGIGVGAGLSMDECMNCEISPEDRERKYKEYDKDTDKDTATMAQVTYNVHALVKCPLSGPDILANTGQVVPSSTSGISSCQGEGCCCTDNNDCNVSAGFRCRGYYPPGVIPPAGGNPAGMNVCTDRPDNATLYLATGETPYCGLAPAP